MADKLFRGGRLHTLVMMLLRRRTETSPPDEALRFLFRLDNEMYWMLGRLSAQYNGGVHTKHRHMKYHDFFKARINEGDRVIDVGCGNGTVANSIADTPGVSVVGIDLNSVNVAFANEKYARDGLTFIHGDALKELPSGPFDVAILSNVLEHLVGRSKFLAALVKNTDVRKVLIRVPLFERDWRVPLKKELGVEWRLDLTHETEYVFEELVAEVHEAGLTLVHVEVRWGEIWAEVEVGDA